MLSDKPSEVDHSRHHTLRAVNLIPDAELVPGVAPCTAFSSEAWHSIIGKKPNRWLR